MHRKDVLLLFLMLVVLTAFVQAQSASCNYPGYCSIYSQCSGCASQPECGWCTASQKCIEVDSVSKTPCNAPCAGCVRINSVDCPRSCTLCPAGSEPRQESTPTAALQCVSCGLGRFNTASGSMCKACPYMTNWINSTYCSSCRWFEHSIGFRDRCTIDDGVVYMLMIAAATLFALIVPMIFSCLCAFYQKRPKLMNARSRQVNRRSSARESVSSPLLPMASDLTDEARYGAVAMEIPPSVSDYQAERANIESRLSRSVSEAPSAPAISHMFAEGTQADHIEFVTRRSQSSSRRTTSSSRMSFRNQPAVIIDNGSYTIKSAMSTNVGNTFAIPTGGCNAGNANAYVGNSNATIPDLRANPIASNNGSIENWPDLERLWFHLYNHELQVDPKDYPLMMTESPVRFTTTRTDHREQLFEVVFERLNVPSFYLCTDAFLKLYSANKTTGVVIDSGYETTRIVPFYCGYIIKDAVRNIPNSGGKAVEHQLRLCMSKTNNSQSLQIGELREIKERFAYVARLNAGTEQLLNSRSVVEQYTLSNSSRTISIGTERYQCTEFLFQSENSIQSALMNSIASCLVDIQHELWSSIVLSGGNMQFGGVVDRLKHEIQLANPTLGATNFNVLASHGRRDYDAVRGGANLSHTFTQWVTRSDYEEKGSAYLMQAVFDIDLKIAQHLNFDPKFTNFNGCEQFLRQLPAEGIRDIFV